MPHPASPGPNSGRGAEPSSREGDAAEGVGEEDVQGAQGFHVGLAPANLRPPQGIDIGRAVSRNIIEHDDIIDHCNTILQYYVFFQHWRMEQQNTPEDIATH